MYSKFGKITIIFAIVFSQLITGSMTAFGTENDALENNNGPESIENNSEVGAVAANSKVVGNKSKAEASELQESESVKKEPRLVATPRIKQPSDKIQVNSAVKQKNSHQVTFKGVTAPNMYVYYEIRVSYWNEYSEGTKADSNGNFSFTTTSIYATTGCLINVSAGVIPGGGYESNSKTCVNIGEEGNGTAPTITAPNLTLNVGDTFNPMQGVSAYDQEDGNITNKVSVTSNNVNTAVAGTYTVTYSVTDSSGMSATAIRTVTVKKAGTKPTITAPNLTLNVGDTFNSMQGVSAYDQEDGDITSKVIVTSNNVNTAVVGTYTVSYKVTDSSGMSATATRQVTVQNTGTAPTINAPNITLKVGDTFIPMQGVTAHDQEDGDITSKVTVTANNVNTAAIGTYSVTYSVTDSSGKTTTAIREVKVEARDAEGVPVINAPNLTLRMGDTFTPMQGVTATDPEDGNITDKVLVTFNNVNTALVGNYTVVYVVTDSSGKTATATRQVQVLSDSVIGTPPVITAPNIIIKLGSTFTPMQGVTAFDLEDGDITSKVMVTANNVNTSVAGKYSVTYTVTDKDKNTVFVTRDVTVQNTTGTGSFPIISAPTISSPIGMSFDPMKDVTAFDVEDGDLTSKITVVSNNVNINAVGGYQVVYAVVDSDNNRTTETRKVIVVQNTIPPTMPIITAPDVTLKVGDSFTPMQGVSALDPQNGNITSKVKIKFNNVDTSKVGNYAVIYTVTTTMNWTTEKTRRVYVIPNTGDIPVVDTNPIYDVTTEVKGKSTGEKVKAYVDGVEVGMAYVDSNGQFTMNILPQKADKSISFVTEFSNGSISGSYSTVVKKATIEITRARKVGIVGQKEQLTVTTNPPGLAVTWSSSNPAVAKVDSYGMVEYLAPGTAIITAKIISGTSASITVTVEKAQAPDVTTPIYDITGSASGTAPANGKVIALVGGKEIGTTTADGNGNFTVTFPKQPVGTVIEFVSETASGQKSEATKVTVKEATIKINEKDTTAFAGKTINLTTTTAPSDAKVTWSSSNTAIAAVSSTGVVTLKTAGTATITAKLENGKSASVKITVIGIPKVDTPIYDVTTEASGTASEGAVVAYVDGEEIGRTMAGSDGKFTITFPEQKAGTTIEFMAEDENGALSDPYNVEVKEASIVINETGKTGFVNDTQQLTATTTPAGQAVTWASSNTNVATVNAKTGLVTFKAVGTVAIKATLKNGKFAQTTITVTKKEIDPPVITTPIYDDTTEASGTATAPGKVIAKDSDGNVLGETTVNPDGSFTVTFPKQPAGTIIEFVAADDKDNESKPTEVKVQESTIKINEKLASAFVGKTANLTTTTTPKDAKVTWTSSSSTIATVSVAGVVTFKAEGTVTITAKLANGKSDTITINVKGSPKVTTPIYDITTAVSGTAPTPGTVVAYVAGNPVGITTVGADGKFNITIPVQKAGTVISFTAKDTEGNESNPTNVTVLASTIKINENISAGFVQDTQQLTATTTPAGQKVTWSTSNATVATVSSTGLVTYLKPGVVTITAAMDNGQKATVTITVTNEVLAVKPPVITTVPVYDVTTTIEGTAKTEGESKAIKVIAYAYGLQIGSADVQADGTFKMTVPAQLAGTMINFVAEDKRGNLSIPTNVIVAQSTVKINEQPTTGFVGETTQLTTTTTPVGQKVTWSTSNATVATVSSTGLVTYKGVGSVVIKATLANGSFAQVTITVTKKEIAAPVITTPIYDNTTTASGTAPTPGKVVAKDKDGKVLGEATVTPEGSFTINFPKQPGDSTIQFVAKDNDNNESKPTDVKVIVSTVVINEKVTTGKVGDTQQLTATTTPAGQKVTWSTSSASIGTIDATTGLVTYKKAGSVTFTAKLDNGESAKITITVTNVNIANPTITTNPIYDVSREVIGKATKPATQVVAYLNGFAIGTADVDSKGDFKMTIPGIMANQDVTFVAEDGKGNASSGVVVKIKAATVIINESRATIQAYVGDTKQLTVTTDPEGQPVVWESDDETIATVDKNGLVTFVGEGKVIITVTLENSHTATDSIVFNVKKKVIEKPTIDQTIYDNTTEVTGKAPAPGKVIAQDKDGNKLGEATVKPDGSFTITFPAQEAGKEIEFVAQDDKGNKSDPTTSPVLATAITINEKITTGFVGDTQSLTATTTPAGQKVTWSVSNTKVASVNATTGLVTYVGVGTVKVTAKLANGKSSSITITVTDKVIAKPTIEGPVYDTTTEISGKAPAPGKVIAYDEDGKKIGEAPVNEDGSFTVTFPEQEAGKTVNFVSEDPKGNKSEPTVEDVIASTIVINEKVAKGLVGDTQTLTATTKPAGQKVTWSSSDKTIATIDATTGVITYKGPGSVTMTASLANGTKATIKITVVDLPQPKLSDVKITDTTVTGTIDTSNFDVKQILILINGVNKTVVNVTSGKFSASIGVQPAGTIIEARYKDQTGEYLTAAKYVGKTTVQAPDSDKIKVNTVTNLQKVVTGKATVPNASVRLYVNDVQKRTGTTDANGNYSFNSGYLKVGDVVRVDLREKNVVTGSATTIVILDTEAMSLEGVTTFSRIVTGKGTENTQFRLSIDGVAKSVKTSDENGVYVFNVKNQPLGTKIKVEMKSAGTYSVFKETTVTEGIVDPNSLTLDTSEAGDRTVTGATEEADTQVRLSINGVTKSVQTSDATTGDFTFNTAVLKAGDVVKVDMKVNGIYAVSKTFTVEGDDGGSGGTDPAYEFTVNPLTAADKTVTGTTTTPKSQLRISLNGTTKSVKTSDAEGKYSYAIGTLKADDVVKVEIRINGVYTNAKEVTVTAAPDLSKELTVNPVAVSDKKVTGSTLNPKTTIRISVNKAVKSTMITDDKGLFVYNNSKLVVGDVIKVEMKVDGVFVVSKEVTVTAGAVQDTITIEDMNATQTVMKGKTNQPNTRIRVSLNGVTKNNITSDKDGNFTYTLGKVKVGDIIKAELQVNNVYTATATTIVKKEPLTADDLTIDPVFVADKQVTIKTIAKTQIRISVNGVTKSTPTTDSTGKYTYNNSKLVAGDKIKVEVKEDGVYTISKTVTVQ
ncbi:DUF5011 domain-containing protein [Listeria booriae]|uniref:immunoglobulin-like domain-containing protein n=1 Tax=Listeria booriae TaxID=1552123 RepID=UPI001629F65F|nr:immunoglobulin-like domain-containing protein [Listeria booriae]MBC1574017.1 DUF5011 domain-containing protein [Listeria booriae]